ncbi:hypothetical protein FNH22_22985 [Fulvivirga sp. M361]|uniref:hypothetical protein n=1 Tax=Fulvivirga sp. M361 TaxID=2594266 RepID=UPI00117B23B8|nr:hypothetical protein [Fulvivirga sp. M361]TRX52041.1 hypothetical protein FNH22_22985 [Fulvivirga sp. M361]
MNKLIFSLIIVSVVAISCEEDDDINTRNCDPNVVISTKEYKEAPKDGLTISNATVEGDSLKISYSSSGCSGETWELKLIASEGILESNPPQRNVRLSLKNDELCDAVISKEISFNICQLQAGGNSVLLNLENFDDRILYEY